MFTWREEVPGKHTTLMRHRDSPGELYSASMGPVLPGWQTHYLRTYRHTYSIWDAYESASFKPEPGKEQETANTMLTELGYTPA